MKKGFILMLLSFALAMVSNFATGQSAKQEYLAALDTLTNADSHRDTVTISGKMHEVTFQFDVTKISGTVAGKVRLFALANGTKFGAIDSVTLVDWTKTYLIKYNYNPGTKYILETETTGTSSASTRHSYMWRRD